MPGRVKWIYSSAILGKVFPVLMQHHLVQVGLSKIFPCWGKGRSFSTGIKHWQQSQALSSVLRSKAGPARNGTGHTAKRALTAAFPHGAARQEHCSLLSWERLAGRHRAARKRAVRLGAAHPALASSNWDHIQHSSLCKRRLLQAPSPGLFTQDPSLIH